MDNIHFHHKTLAIEPIVDYLKSHSIGNTPTNEFEKVINNVISQICKNEHVSVDKIHIPTLLSHPTDQGHSLLELTFRKRNLNAFIVLIKRGVDISPRLREIIEKSDDKETRKFYSALKIKQKKVASKRTKKYHKINRKTIRR